MIVYWRRKEQELAAAAERDIPGPLQTDRPQRQVGSTGEDVYRVRGVSLQGSR
jgi:hypothetical protein